MERVKQALCTRFLFGLAISIIGLCTTISGDCLAKDTQPPNEIVVRMGSFTKAVDFAPYLIAKHKHLFEQALKPLSGRVTYEVFQSLPSINEAMASKNLDAVFEAEAPAIVGRAAGIGLKIVEVSAVLNLQMLVHKNSGITRVKDLRGKKIAVLAGTSAHYGVLENLERAGLTKNDVSIVDMTPPDARSAFDSKKVDAWAVWPPFVEQEVIAGTGTPLPGFNADIDVVMVVREGFAIDHGPILQTLVSVVRQTKQWIFSHPGEAQEIVAGELNVPLNVVKLAWPRHIWQAQLTDSLCKDIQNKADFLKTVGMVRKQIVVRDGFIDTSFKTALK